MNVHDVSCLISIADFELDLGGQIFMTYEHHEPMKAIRESGGLAIVPAQLSMVEVTGVRVRANNKLHNADWLLHYLTLDQLQMIQTDILESLE